MEHKELDAWKQSINLVEEVYKLSLRFPKQELYGLTSQVRRAAISVPSNLSEGAGRNGNKEFHNFLGISLGSLAELETQMIIAARLGYVEVSDLLSMICRVRALIIGLRKSINRTQASSN